MSSPNHEDLLAYCKGEEEGLPNRQGIEDQVSQCPETAKLCEEIENHLKLYQKLPSFEPSPQLWENLKEEASSSLKKTPAKQSNLFFTISLREFILPAITIAAALLFIFVLLSSWGNLKPLRLHMTQGIASLSPQFSGTTHLNMNSLLQGQWQGKVSSQTQIATLVNTTAKFQLPSQVTCFLGFNTKILLHSEKEIQLKKGDLYIEVPSGKPFHINTPQGKIEVLGTVFYLSCNSTDPFLRVYRGKVSFRNDHGHQVVSSGKELKLTASLLSSPQAQANSDIPHWTKAPFSLYIKKHTNNLGHLEIETEIKNLGPEKLELSFFAGATPHFLVDIKNVSSPDKSYKAPLFSSPPDASAKISLSPSNSIQLKRDLTSLISAPGEYIVSVIYQGPFSSQINSDGIINSNSVSIHIPK